MHGKKKKARSKRKKAHDKKKKMHGKKKKKAHNKFMITEKRIQLHIVTKHILLSVKP